MPELNQSLYNASYESLTEANVPEYLADAVSRIVATDEPDVPNLGRNDIDIELCCEAVISAISSDDWETD
ncbi:hypothetical protein [Brunnivagina elsteri]|uniref:Uncharacterized protein n=1 Tax=Brunnivagina elsteri CCALA 953 TaxID=987040 RepID=A0A2A2TGR7_9CYAN|nr:hypothetical protein [Calothrix elsteri]PAX52866.1 hypothetical protein CK510_17055 [Calothrix elsteri CCALA 953]